MRNCRPERSSIIGAVGGDIGSRSFAFFRNSGDIADIVGSVGGRITLGDHRPVLSSISYNDIRETHLVSLDERQSDVEIRRCHITADEEVADLAYSGGVGTVRLLCGNS